MCYAGVPARLWVSIDVRRCPRTAHFENVAASSNFGSNSNHLGSLFVGLVMNVCVVQAMAPTNSSLYKLDSTLTWAWLKSRRMDGTLQKLGKDVRRCKLYTNSNHLVVSALSVSGGPLSRGAFLR